MEGTGRRHLGGPFHRKGRDPVWPRLLQKEAGRPSRPHPPGLRLFATRLQRTRIRYECEITTSKRAAPLLEGAGGGFRIIGMEGSLDAHDILQAAALLAFTRHFPPSPFVGRMIRLKTARARRGLFHANPLMAPPAGRKGFVPQPFRHVQGFRDTPLLSFWLQIRLFTGAFQLRPASGTPWRPGRKHRRSCESPLLPPNGQTPPGKTFRASR